MRACRLCVLFAWLASAPVRAQESEPGIRLELSGYAGAVLPARREHGLAPAGVSLGVSALLRVVDWFAVGAIGEWDRLGWDAAGPRDGVSPGLPDPNGSVSQTSLLGALRFYFASTEFVHAHAQLAVGYSKLPYSPKPPQCSADDGLGFQLAVGVDAVATRALRFGISGAVAPAALGFGCTDIGGPNVPPDAPFPVFLWAARATATYAFELK